MKNTIIWLFGLWILSLNVQAQRLSQKSTVSLLTVSSGADISDAFGHTAIRIKDDSLGMDTAFNYGVYDGFGKGFVLKFMRGQTDYLIATDFTPEILARYQSENRQVTEQHLAMDLSQRQRLLDDLVRNLLPENRMYRYEFFFDNCATRARDVLIKSFGQPVKWETKINPHLSLRDLLDIELQDKKWWKFGIDLVLGSRIDREATQSETMFLPERLRANFEEAKVQQGEGWVKMVSKSQVIVPQSKQNITKSLSPLITAWILCFLAFGMSYYRQRVPNVIVKIFDVILFGFAAVLGILIILLWFFTEHRSTPENWNILWSLPFVAYLFAPKRRWVRLPVIAGLLTTTLIACIHWFYPMQAFHPAVFPLLIALWLRVTPLFPQKHTQTTL